MPRLFTGVEIPPDVALDLDMMRGGVIGARWLDRENYHITLRFIGDIEDGLAREIASETAPVAVAITKRLLWRQMMESDAERGLALEERFFAWSVDTADAKEGIASFLEKRAPQWKMKARAEFPPDLLPDMHDR